MSLPGPGDLDPGPKWCLMPGACPHEHPEPEPERDIMEQFFQDLEDRCLATLDDRDEWLAARRLGIGGSDAAAVLGWSPWSSPWSLWLDKVGVAGDVEQNEAMEFGTRLESVVAEAYADRTGLEVIDAPGVYQHREQSWMLASPDRFILDDEHDGPGYLEIKTTSAFKADEWAEGEVPLQYLAQWQHCAEVFGVKWGAFAALIGGNRLVIREMEYDPEFAQMLVAAEYDFWHDHVLANVPPPMDGMETTTEALEAMFSEADPESVVELDVTVARAIIDYRRASDAAKEAEADKRQAGNVLREALGTAEAATFQGTQVATWKGSPRTDIDTKRLKAEMPEIAKKFERTKVVRTLRPGRSKAALEALETITDGGN